MSGSTVLSLFSGAGGLDIGLEQAGFHMLGQVEMDDDSVDTLRLHAEGKTEPPRIYHCRIEDLDPREVRGDLGLRRGDLTLMAGGPPCQPFTTAGLRKAINDRRAASAILPMLTFLEEFEPRAVLVENVDGILSAALDHRPLKKRGGDHPPLAWEETKGSFLHWFLTELGDRGYSVSWGVLEAADHGVPQMRQRAFMIGVRGDKPCYLPRPTYGQTGLPPYRTLADALADLDELGSVQPLSDRKTEVLAEIPAGGNWRNLPEKRQRETMGAAYHATGGKSGWWRRLDWGSPSPTILGMPDHSSTALIHPDEVRCLSVNECAALQSFPKGTRFSGTSRSQYQQIGNAVPPGLGKAVGEAILSALDGEEQSPPAPPKWRKASANRRIGTHGWSIAKDGRVTFRVIAKIRDDHVWAQTEQPQLEFV